MATAPLPASCQRSAANAGKAAVARRAAKPLFPSLVRVLAAIAVDFTACDIRRLFARFVKILLNIRLCRPALSGPAFLLKVPPETRPNKVLLSKASG